MLMENIDVRDAFFDQLVILLQGIQMLLLLVQIWMHLV